ncbi:MAG TPA: 2OG-Fe(II) oxygenase [Caulobacteraceae bacterium]|jgi:prolyl 4-hydroxylase|nr:2OG-Fe(II) oxygenase [Caulobacteraceae bacterium]
MATDPREIEARAIQGDPRAQFAYAALLDQQGRHPEALNWLERAARAGDARAGSFLGARLLTGYAAPKLPDRAAEMLALAARNGGAEANELTAAMRAAGRFLPQDWSAAFDALQRAAEAGEPRARDQLRILAGGDHDTSPAALRARIRVEGLLSVPRPRALSTTARIAAYDNFLPPARCDWLIERARGRIRPARVYDETSGGGVESRTRSNGSTEFHLIESDVIMAVTRARISRATGIATANCEELAILHYEPGQEFARHVDFLDPDNPAHAKVIAERGQRVATFLIYLSDDFDGGETEFPHLGLRFKGRKGDAILFWNTDAAGRPDRMTLHAGLAPTRGRKWLLSQFLRDRAWPYE